MIEEVFKKKQYENFNEWVTNFSINLPHIWKELSASTLTPNTKKIARKDKQSAIVIGRGPSINRLNHLKLLSESNYKGTIVCCDGKLADALKAGITPEKFPKFYVVTIDPYANIKKHYQHSIVKEYGSKIKGIFTVISNPDSVNTAREAGIKIHWIHSLFDYNEGEKSFNKISALMIRAKNDEHRLPGIQTGGNVGTASWFISWQILRCNIISLLGINHGWEEEDSWDTIIHHNYKSEILEGVSQNSPVFKKLYPKIFNPDFKKYCIMDPLFQFYSMALKEFIERSPKWVKTINSTEGGSIFGERIQSMKFSKFLSKYEF